MSIIPTITTILISLAISGGIVGFIIWLTRRKKQVHGITVCNNIRIELTPKSTLLTPDIVNKWINELVEFWWKAKFWPLDEISNSIKNIHITMHDQYYLVLPSDKNQPGRKVCAATYPTSKVIMIATLPKKDSRQTIEKRLRSLIRHELSHMISGYMNSAWNETEDHAMFKEVGL